MARPKVEEGDIVFLKTSVFPGSFESIIFIIIFNRWNWPDKIDLNFLGHCITRKDRYEEYLPWCVSKFQKISENRWFCE